MPNSAKDQSYRSFFTGYLREATQNFTGGFLVTAFMMAASAAVT